MGSYSEVFRDMRASDIEFTINDGDYKGDVYGFTLARKDGKKAWQVSRIYSKPPSLVKHKIEMAITAREDNVRASGAWEHDRIEEILEKMSRVADEIEPVKLHGLDGEDYLVRIDRDGLQTDNVIDEKDRSPEFLLRVNAWSLYD